MASSFCVLGQTHLKHTDRVILRSGKSETVISYRAYISMRDGQSKPKILSLVILQIKLSFAVCAICQSSGPRCSKVR